MQYVVCKYLYYCKNQNITKFYKKRSISCPLDFSGASVAVKVAP